MKVAVFDRPGRITFTMTRFEMLRLAVNAFLAAIRGEKGIAIGTGDLEVLSATPPIGTGEDAKR